MKRRAFIEGAAAGLGSAALAGGVLSQLSACSRPSVSRPNIVYILADDLGWGDPGCYGQELIPTPHLDSLAADGMRFDRHYAGSTVCAPSRCCLMTGRHTGHSCIRGNREVRPEGQWPIPDEEFTVAELLHEAGYVTGLFGKWGLGGPDSEGHPNRQGFDEFFGYLCQREAHFYYPEWLRANHRQVSLPGNAGGARGTFSHDLIVERALDFIRARADEPFFCFLPVTIPHAELAVPEQDLAPWRGRFDETPWPAGRHYGEQAEPKAAYAAMVSRLDRDVGRVRALLEELGLGRNTLVIFSSDNGPHREGGHDPAFFRSSGPFRGIKRDLYEGGIRVPMLAAWPGVIEAGSHTDHPCAFWDLLSTLSDLTGTPIPADAPGPIDGISFLPALTGRRQREHDYLYWEFHEQGGKQALMRGDWKAVRLNVNRDGFEAPLELYNLAEDPGETTDLAVGNPDLCAELAGLMHTARTPSHIFPFGDQEG